MEIEERYKVIKDTISTLNKQFDETSDWTALIYDIMYQGKVCTMGLITQEGVLNGGIETTEEEWKEFHRMNMKYQQPTYEDEASFYEDTKTKIYR